MRPDCFRRLIPAGLAGVLVIAAASRLQARVEFVGVLAMDGSTRFYLSDSEVGSSSGWISLQDSFAGYTLTGYDPSRDILTLQRNGEETRIALRDAPIAASRIEIRGTLTFTAGQNEPLQIDRATFLLDQENILPLRNDGAQLRITPTLLPADERMPAGGLFYHIVHEIPDSAEGLKVIHNIRIVALPGQRFGLDISEGADDPDAIRLSFEPVN